MKTILVLLALLASVFASAQEMAPIAKELDMIKFMTGKWKGDLTGYMMGQEDKGQSSVDGKMSLGGRYLESDHSYTFPGMGTMTGKHMLGYDSAKKSFYAFWFDSMGDGAMELWGNWTGNTLTMVSKPMEMPGAPAPMVMRTIYKKISDTKFEFSLEMKQGEKWEPLMKGSYTKV